ncbi:MAG: ribose ABC transporter permease, partial [Christensenella sp.]|uniref:ABC transporter permease n=1 Tax=Christensenella sp. TaxID=1935934 RepID=UPI002B3A4EFF|nr:ribose ABC transporter permease [Christensenella sp.]
MVSKSNQLESNRGMTAKEIFVKYGIVFALIILIVVLSIASDKFFVPTNLITILTQTSINALLAIGMTFVILTGGIDLSVGSILAVSGVVFATFAKQQDGVQMFPTIVPIVMACLTGLAFGAFNGVIVAKAKVAPFIVTLGTLTIARGAALLLSDG